VGRTHARFMAKKKQLAELRRLNGAAAHQREKIATVI
jgi:hypothetical protein